MQVLMNNLQNLQLVQKNAALWLKHRWVYICNFVKYFRNYCRSADLQFGSNISLQSCRLLKTNSDCGCCGVTFPIKSCRLEVRHCWKNGDCGYEDLQLRSTISLDVADMQLRKYFLQVAELRLRIYSRIIFLVSRGGREKSSGSVAGICGGN
jgi:hypothetical protein